MKKIIVIGSSNIDMVVRTSHLPAPGETILGGEFFMNQGGKGANQAVAVKRLGGNLIFVAKLGNDILGQQSVDYFKKEGIDTKYITLDENSASGANMLLNEQDVDKVVEEMCEGDILLMQLEIPIQTVEYAARRAFEKGVKVVLNPAPARSLPKELLRYLFMITPNRIEAEMLTGIKIVNDADAERVAKEISAMGVQNIIVTLGSKGCLVREGDTSYCVDAFKVEPVDTTAAGDTFNGALCVGLAEGMNLRQAAVMASKASSVAVTRMGAQSSIPHRKELDLNE
ncbi:ribokinase [Bacteroides cellulosilyticus]|jgi:ribokinase|uniref:ribokinase n=1 Tax=Bacteroides cellulosilyticus TaxID=246787 RepID=UPI00189F6DB8|nr:ribokinase [Bacteroides cellulosilyticus]